MLTEVTEEQLQPNLFLTNVIETTVQNKSRKISFEPTFGNIETWFEENARLLSEKKQRAKRHRQRLKQLEGQFQKKQGQLQRSLFQKIVHSSKIKSKNLEKIQQRLHKNSQKLQKISEKSRIKHEQQIRKKLQERKSFEPEDYQYNSKFSRKSRTSSTEQRVQLSKQKMKKTDQDLNRILHLYKEKQKRANDVSLQMKRQAAQRARSHNSIEVTDVKHRAQTLKQREKRMQSLQVITRLDQVNAVRKNKQKLIESKHERNHKSFSQKITRIKNNLLQIQQERNTKYNELTEKFEKKIQKRGWRERKTTMSSRRLIQNLQALESDQMAKADRIVEKHRQIDQKYRFYKQKKEQLYKTFVKSKD